MAVRTTKPTVLDLFCGAGGASAGYASAGYEVIGVDIADQPNYPYEFVKGDALQFAELYAHEFDLVHASPPCQRFSIMTQRWGTEGNHPDLIDPTRQILRRKCMAYVIENVPGSPLIEPIRLCGSMFDLEVRRHRWFETNPVIDQPECHHDRQDRVIGVYGHPGGSSKRDGITFGQVADWKRAMGIEWMTAKELKEAIPPAYTHEIGTQIGRLFGWL